MNVVYVTTLLFAFAVTIAPALQYLFNFGFDLIGVGVGYRTLFIDIALLFLTVVVLFASRERRVMARLVAIGALWIPWLLYLAYSSGFQGIGLWKLQMHLARVVIPCFAILVLYLSWPDKFSKYFFRSIVWAALVLIALTYSFDLADKDFYRNIWLSRLVAIAALYLFIHIVDDHRYRNIPILVVFAVAMFMIGSRGPFLSFALTAMLYFGIRKWGNGLAIFLAVLVFAAFSTLFLLIPELVHTTAGFLSHGNATSISDVQVDRVGIYLPTLKLVETAPVFGLGLGKWSEVYSAVYRVGFEDPYTYPHNIILEVLSELGVVGLILFLLLFFPFRRMFDLSNQYNIFILLAFLFAMTSSDITQNSAVFLFSLLSLAEYRRRRARKNAEARNPERVPLSV